MKVIILCLAILTLTTTAQAIELTASWYSMDSLKAEGTYNKTKGVTANGELFTDNSNTCACNLYPFGTWLLITAIESGNSIIVRVNDRIAKRFGRTRIDLPEGQFNRLANCKRGIIQVKVKELK